MMHRNALEIISPSCFDFVKGYKNHNQVCSGVFCNKILCSKITFQAPTKKVVLRNWFSFRLNKIIMSLANLVVRCPDINEFIFWWLKEKRLEHIRKQHFKNAI